MQEIDNQNIKIRWKHGVSIFPNKLLEMHFQ